MIFRVTVNLGKYIHGQMSATVIFGGVGVRRGKSPTLTRRMFGFNCSVDHCTALTYTYVGTENRLRAAEESRKLTGSRI